MIYTVGYEKGYDEQLANLRTNGGFLKTGRNGSYPGGFAVRNTEDAARLIREWGKEGEWAIYQVAASWEKDTKPSLQGWWHALQRDAAIVKKVAAPSFPEAWDVEAEDVKQLKIVAPMEESQAVMDWIYDRGGNVTRSGPAVKNFPQMDVTRCLIIGWVPLHLPDVEGG